MPTIQFAIKPALTALLLAGLVTGLTACRPSGSKALLDGRRLLQAEQFGPAAQKLRLAVSLLPTNAAAWNDLGLAYHHSDHPAEALAAYQTALKFNHDLVVVHFNLGCLHLEQNHLEAAKNELTAYTVHEAKAPEGWLKLGDTQLRLGDLVGAEASFRQVLNFDLQNLEALNNLGVIQFRRGRLRDAQTWFTLALKQKADYGPTLLNLAVLYQSIPANRGYALRKYQEYLALQPRPANWDAISNAARLLELELNPPPVTRVVSNPPPVAVVAATNAVKPVASNSLPANLAAAATNPPAVPLAMGTTNPPLLVKTSVPPATLAAATNPTPASPIALTNASKPPLVATAPLIKTGSPTNALRAAATNSAMAAARTNPVPLLPGHGAATSVPPAVVTAPAVRPVVVAAPPIVPPLNVAATKPVMKAPPALTPTVVVVDSRPWSALVAPAGPVEPPATLPTPKPVVPPPAAEAEPTLPSVVVPVYQPTEALAEGPRPAATPVPTPVDSIPTGVANTETNKPAKKSFFSRLNPAKLFGRDAKPVVTETPLPPLELGPETPIAGAGVPVTVAELKPAPAPKPAHPAPPRYPRPVAGKLNPGNRVEAERLALAAQSAQRNGAMAEALAGFQAATQADPTYFEGQSNLGLAAYEAGDSAQALSALDRALRLNPRAFGPRVNFGLALRSAGYPIDAAEEWERVLAMHPAEAANRRSAVHLLLATLYADQFHQPKAARPHFQQVLDLEPNHPQAETIRYWLAGHP